MSLFICPVCKEKLIRENRSLICQNNHCFDISKQGYVNLLQSQKNSLKRHGDDKLMVMARKEFLEKGYYKPLLKKTYEIVDNHIKNDIRILDAGCGECYYTANILNYIKGQGYNASVCGVDIAKDVMICASHRSKDIEIAVASVFDIPVADNSFDIIFNFFAPTAEKEYTRILSQDGILVRAVPLKYHLWELKCSIYDTPYENDEIDTALDGLQLIEQYEIKDVITIESNEDIQNLFKMTPYYYKTSRKDQEKLETINSLTTKIEFGIFVYKKTNNISPTSA